MLAGLVLPILIALFSIAIPIEAMTATAQSPEHPGSTEALNGADSDEPAHETPPSVSVKASPASPRVGQAAKLRASISNPPPGLQASYEWQMDLAGSWETFGSRPTFAYLAAKPETWRFRVRVSFGDGSAATSDPLTVSWAELEQPPDDPEPPPEQSEPDPIAPDEPAPAPESSQTDRDAPKNPRGLAARNLDSNVDPYARLDVSRAAFNENDLSIDITVTVTRNTDVGVANVSLDLSGTAVKDAHYTVTPSALPVLRIGSGSTTASTVLTFSGVPDSAVEGDKSIAVSGTSGAGTVTGTTITVKDSIAKPGGPVVTRTGSTKQADPALDVSWTAPTSPGDPISGYLARYRKEGQSGWTAYTESISATTNKLVLSGLDPGATYQVQVRALRGGTAGPWSDVRSGKTNRPPTRTLTGPTQGQRVDVEWEGSGDVRSLENYFADADGDALTYFAGTDSPRIIEAAIEGSDLSDLRIRFLNPISATITFGGRDGYGGHKQDWLTIHPSANASRSVPENAAAGTAVGDPVTGTPVGDEALSHSLSGPATDAFEIDASTGQIKVKEGADLDYETKSSYSGTVTWTVQGQTATVYLSIRVEDLGPAMVGTPTVSRTKSSEQSNPGLDVSWATVSSNGSAVSGYEARYRKSGEDEWTDYGGALAAAATSLKLPNLGPGETVEAQVRAFTADDEFGDWSEIGSGRSNRPPQFDEPPNLGISYQPQWGGEDLIYSISDKFADPDGDTLTYAATTEHPGVFTVTVEGANPVNARIHVLNPAASTVTISVQDGYGGAASTTIDVSGISAMSRVVTEDSAAGTKVGDPITGTPHAGAALSYALAGDAAGSFAIDSATGQISVKQGATIHYESRSSYSGRVTWTVQGLEAYVDLTISVRPLNVTRSVGENYPAGTAVGAPVTWAGTTIHELGGEASTSGAFAIDSATGQISVAADADLDHATKSSYAGVVSYRGGTLEGTIGVTINVTQPVPGRPAAPSFTRTRFSEPTPPALDLAWSAAPAYGASVTKYEARYRQQGETGWTTYGGTLGADARTLNLAGLEAGAIYEAQVRAFAAAGPGPWSPTGAGRSNRPPERPLSGDRHTPPWPSRTLEWGHSDSYAKIYQHFEDPDGDQLTVSAGSDDPCTLRIWMQGKVLRAYMNNPVGEATRVYANAHDPYGGVSATQWSFYHGYSRKSREVTENSPAGTPVGDPIVGSSCSGGSFTYGFYDEETNELADNFRIDSSTGQVRVEEGADLDFEGETTSWRGAVVWTVSWGRTAAVLLTITVTDAEPGPIDPPTLSRTRFNGPAPPGLDVTWTAPADNGETISGYELQFRRQAAEGQDPANWTAYSGTLRATDRSVNLANLAAGAVYEAQVRALYGDQGPGPWSETGQGRANRPPTAIGTALSAAAVSVGVAAEYDITDQFADADGDALTFWASSQAPGIITAAANPGRLGITAVNPASAEIDYGVHDGFGGSAVRVFAASGIRSESRAVTENSGAGTAVGHPVTGVPYNREALVYALAGEAAGAFTIDAATGQIRVKHGQTLDYETKRSYDGQVTWTVQGRTAITALQVTIRDVSPPGPPSAPGLTPDEGDPTSKLNAAWSRPRRSGGASITKYQLRYRESGAKAWERLNTAGTVTAVTLDTLAKETRYEAQVRAANVEGYGSWSPLGEGATRAGNLAPRFSVAAAVRHIPENSPIGTLAGDPVLATDPDGPSLAYSLQETSRLFEIDSATGQVELASPSLDFESRSSYTLVVGASDGINPQWIEDDPAIDAEITVNIQVTDVDEPPPKLAAPTVARSARSPQSALIVSWVPPDMTGKPPVTRYSVTYREAGSADWENERRVPAPQTEIAFSGLRAGARYEFLVRAENDEGTSPWSDPGSGSTLTDPTPPAPVPTLAPTATPTPGPRPDPTPPAPVPTLAPTATPTPGPRPDPTPPAPVPTLAPTATPTPGPRPDPTPPAPVPTLAPTATPTPGPRSPRATDGSRASTPGPSAALNPPAARPALPFLAWQNPWSSNPAMLDPGSPEPEPAAPPLPTPAHHLAPAREMASQQEPRDLPRLNRPSVIPIPNDGEALPFVNEAAPRHSDSPIRRARAPP